MMHSFTSGGEKKKKKLSLADGVSIGNDRLSDVSPRLSVAFAAILVTFHCVFLTWGSAQVWQNDWLWMLSLPVGVMALMLLARIYRPETAEHWWYHPMLIYLAVAITATWLILVGMYIDPVEPDKESISLQKFTANVSDAELRNKLKDLRNSDAHQRVSVLVDVDEIVELTLKSTQDIDFEAIAHVGFQLVTPVIILTRWLMPLIDITTQQLSRLLVTGVVISFDTVELQNNIRNEDVRNDESLAYVILLFTSLSLLQLLQLSEALARRVMSSQQWEMFWTLYGIVCQEIPFFVIRIYILCVSGFEVVQLIFPIKNAFCIIFGIYRMFAIYKRAQTEEQEEQDETNSAASSEMHTDTIERLVIRGVIPILVLMAHLLLLIWRVTVVHDNLCFWLLSLSVLLFAALIVPRLVLNQQGISNTKMKASVWYQPLLVYLLMGLTCFWLIILTLADEKQFLSTDSLPSVEFLKTECNRTKYENNTNGQQFLTSFSSPSPAECLLDPSDPKLLDEVSYSLLQLVLPLTVFGRWWMPRVGLSSSVFSSLLPITVAMAFDVAEFSHLVVEEPDLNKNRALLILVLLFTSTSILLLAHIDVGMASGNKIIGIIWMLLTVLLFDGPFFVLRMYIATEYNSEDLQLVFLLKNLFGILFGGYCVLYLLTTKDESSGVGRKLDRVMFQPNLGTFHLPEQYVQEVYVNRKITETKSGVSGMHGQV